MRTVQLVRASPTLWITPYSASQIGTSWSVVLPLGLTTWSESIRSGGMPRSLSAALNERVIESRSVSILSRPTVCRPRKVESTPPPLGTTYSDSGASAKLFSEMSPRSRTSVGFLAAFAGRVSTSA